jgi:hypothetical protein
MNNAVLQNSDFDSDNRIVDLQNDKVNISEVLARADELRVNYASTVSNLRVPIPQATYNSPSADGPNVSMAWVTSIIGKPQAIAVTQLAALRSDNTIVYGDPWTVDPTPGTDVGLLQHETGPERVFRTMNTTSAAIGIQFPVEQKIKHIKLRLAPVPGTDTRGLVLVVCNRDRSYVQHFDLDTKAIIGGTYLFNLT